ncbi:MAG: hypothetical protein KDK27_06515 [Leptospiraceae bacterium]|nr:hypothetical protein [Leptospiraceae bacterium]
MYSFRSIIIAVLFVLVTLYLPLAVLSKSIIDLPLLPLAPSCDYMNPTPEFIELCNTEMRNIVIAYSIFILLMALICIRMHGRSGHLWHYPILTFALLAFFWIGFIAPFYVLELLKPDANYVLFNEINTILFLGGPLIGVLTIGFFQFQNFANMSRAHHNQ